ncbi:MAG TPA: hypothetical protein VGO58_11670 [Chitinophagaceae bacterium]|jgi:hypothetical protein|nr:hypothetical protein [Chitinophagaceae bacterium]
MGHTDDMFNKADTQIDREYANSKSVEEIKSAEDSYQDQVKVISDINAAAHSLAEVVTFGMGMLAVEIGVEFPPIVLLAISMEVAMDAQKKGKLFKFAPISVIPTKETREDTGGRMQKDMNEYAGKYGVPVKNYTQLKKLTRDQLNKFPKDPKDLREKLQSKNSSVGAMNLYHKQMADFSFARHKNLYDYFVYRAGGISQIVHAFNSPVSPKNLAATHKHVLDHDINVLSPFFRK